MPLQSPPRLSSVLAGLIALAGVVLTATGCSHLTPLGPAPPQPSHLRSPFVLEALRIRPATPAGGCPAGYVTIAGNPGLCYRKTGTPVTITTAAVTPVSSSQPDSRQYEVTVILPAADVPELTAVAAKAASVRGTLAVSVAGRTWVLPIVTGPWRGRQLFIPLPSKNQADQLQRLLSGQVS